MHVINRFDEARAVLQTPLLLIDKVSQSSFSSKSLKCLHFKTVRDRELKVGEDVHLLPHVMCNMPRVMCNVSHVMCHRSHVTSGFFWTKRWS